MRSRADEEIEAMARLSGFATAVLHKPTMTVTTMLERA